MPETLSCERGPDNRCYVINPVLSRSGNVDRIATLEALALQYLTALDTISHQQLEVQSLAHELASALTQQALRDAHWTSRFLPKHLRPK